MKKKPRNKPIVSGNLNPAATTYPVYSIFNWPKVYQNKRQWKFALFVSAILIVLASLWYSNVLVQKIAQNERSKIRTWAEAIQHRAKILNTTNSFFNQVREEERKRVELYAKAWEKLASPETNTDLSFYLDILQNNTTVPVILTDEKGHIDYTVNVELKPGADHTMTPGLLKEYSVYKPLTIPYYANEKKYLYYKDSKLFTDVRLVLDDLVSSFFQQVVENAGNVPIVVTDSLNHDLIAYGNVDTVRLHEYPYRQKLIERMKSENDPLVIDIAEKGRCFIYYRESLLLRQLRYLPFIQWGVILAFLLIAYALFSTARKSEQNQVWAGLAKETAHQLGTPLSSMMAWVDLLEAKGIDPETIDELQKDVSRLKTVTDRFSKIGSTPVLKPENIVQLIYNSVSYLKTRTSQKVHFTIAPLETEQIIVPLNYQLFDWVIENLVKNAVDAMTGKGDIVIEVIDDEDTVTVDVTDSGKGMPRHMFQSVFNPGFTSKQRGWGLGLSLSKRIINEYHFGKIFVRSSSVGKGTTFRIVLNK
jgi:signal transduction histidine kinase